MVKFSNIVGLPVIHAKTGRIIANVKDIIFIPETQEIFALIVSCKGFISFTKAIKRSNIIQINRNSILVEDLEVLIPVSNVSKLPNIKKCKEEIIKTPVYTDSGMKVGTIQDALFDFEIGKLTEFEISDGIVQDLIDGRKVISASESIPSEQGILKLDHVKIRQLRDKGKGLKKYFREGSNENGKE